MWLPSLGIPAMDLPMSILIDGVGCNLKENQSHHQDPSGRSHMMQWLMQRPVGHLMPNALSDQLSDVPSIWVSNA